MKRFVLFIFFMFVLCGAHSDTFNQYWYTGLDLYAQTTCQTGGDINLPTAPTKYGYDFIGWEKLSYTPLQYIESTGTQYINTGYIPNDNTRMEILYKVTAMDIYKCAAASPIGGRVAYLNKNFLIFSPVNALDTNMLCYANACTSLNFESVNKEIIGIIDIPNNYVALKTKDQEYSTNPNIQHVTYEQPLYLFVYNNNGRATTCDGLHKQIMYVKLSENGVMILDMIPVLDSNGTPCMYDKVTQQCFYNQGTGDFIAGPVL